MIAWKCAECGEPAKLYDYQAERQWRHLDTRQCRTVLHARPPRAECGQHGVLVVKLPCAEASSRFRALFEAPAIEWLKQASQKAVGRQMGLSWEEIHGIMQRAVERGLERRKAERVSQIGIDEKAFRRGHRQVSLVNDVVRTRVLEVAEGREQSSLDGFWERLTEEQLGDIEAVAMDMWEPYVNSVQEHLPDADSKIVFDKFHIARHLGDAVDQVRRKKHKTRKAAGDECLAGTRYDWRKNPTAVEPKERRELAERRKSGLKTARAWALKETGMALFSCVSERPARKHFRWRHNWAVRSCLQPMLEVGRMLKGRFENIITYLRHGLTNAASESINAKIQWVKYTARGFRNLRNFLYAIYFHCGGLDLAPATH